MQTCIDPQISQRYKRKQKHLTRPALAARRGERTLGAPFAKVREFEAHSKSSAGVEHVLTALNRADILKAVDVRSSGADERTGLPSHCEWE